MLSELIYVNAIVNILFFYFGTVIFYI